MQAPPLLGVELGRDVERHPVHLADRTPELAQDAQRLGVLLVEVEAHGRAVRQPLGPGQQVGPGPRVERLSLRVHPGRERAQDLLQLDPEAEGRVRGDDQAVDDAVQAGRELGEGQRPAARAGRLGAHQGGDRGRVGARVERAEIGAHPLGAGAEGGQRQPLHDRLEQRRVELLGLEAPQQVDRQQLDRVDERVVLHPGAQVREPLAQLADQRVGRLLPRDRRHDLTVRALEDARAASFHRPTSPPRRRSPPDTVAGMLRCSDRPAVPHGAVPPARARRLTGGGQPVGSADRPPRGPGAARAS